MKRARSWCASVVSDAVIVEISLTVRVRIYGRPMSARACKNYKQLIRELMSRSLVKPGRTWSGRSFSPVAVEKTGQSGYDH